MTAKVKEVRSIVGAPGHDPNCATCERRKDRLYADDIWRRALERYERCGSASVEIDRR